MPPEITTSIFTEIRHHLSSAIGPDRALTIDHLTGLVGSPNRRTTEVVLETHLGDFGFLVISGSSGYFRPSSPDQVNRYIASLESRIKCLSTRRSTIVRAALESGWNREAGQFTSTPRQPELDGLPLFSQK